MKLVQRRLFNVSLLCLAFGLIIFIQQLNSYTLVNNAFFNGWLLLTLMLLLYLFTVRKRIVGVCKLGKVSLWMQAHIYLGLLAAAVFLLHAGWQVPEGLLKQFLYFIFIAEVLSGLLGLMITRLLPPCLARNGSVLYQDILGQQQQLAKEVEILVEHSLATTGSNTIAQFYQRFLLHFLLRPRYFWSHILQYRKIIHRFNAEFSHLQRYLNHDEQQILQEIQLLVVEKNRLDYQYAGQTLLKRWLWLHIPLSGILILFSLLHLVLVYAYIGAV